MLFKTYKKEIKKNYEIKFIKTVVIEEIAQKLKEIQKLFEEKINDNTEELTKLINNKYFINKNKNKNKLTYNG